MQAIGKFPAICGYQGTETKSDDVCRRTLATMFAHFAQETGEHNKSDKEVEEWRQGLAHLRELGCTDTSPGNIHLHFAFDKPPHLKVVTTTTTARRRTASLTSGAAARTGRASGRNTTGGEPSSSATTSTTDSSARRCLVKVVFS